MSRLVVVISSLAALSWGERVGSRGRDVRPEVRRQVLVRSGRADARPGRAPAPHEPQLLRMAEIMGALAYLRDLCGAGDGCEFPRENGGVPECGGRRRASSAISSRRLQQGLPRLRDDVSRLHSNRRRGHFPVSQGDGAARGGRRQPFWRLNMALRRARGRWAHWPFAPLINMNATWASEVVSAALKAWISSAMPAFSASDRLAAIGASPEGPNEAWQQEPLPCSSRAAATRPQAARR